MSRFGADQIAAIGDALASTAPDTTDSSSSPSQDVNTADSSGPDVNKATSSSEGNQGTGDTPDTESSFDSDSTDDRDSGKGTPSSIPYKRFKDAISERNSLRKQLEELQARIDAQGSRPTQPTPDPVQSSTPESDTGSSWLDKILSSGSEQEQDGGPLADRLAYMEQRFQELEVKQIQRQLTREVDSLVEQYPSVPRQALLQAVVQDPSVNLTHVAEQYALFVAGIEERALSRHQEAAAQKKAAAPRPAGSSGNARTSHQGSDDAKPKTLKDASKAALRHLKDTKLFG